MQTNAALPTISLTEEELLNASLGQLQQFADRVGVGYAELDEEGLRKRLMFEGAIQ